MRYFHTFSWVLSYMWTAAPAAGKTEKNEKTEKSATKTETASAPAIGLCVVSVK